MEAVTPLRTAKGVYEDQSVLVVDEDVSAKWTQLAFTIRGLEHAIYDATEPLPSSVLATDDDGCSAEKSSQWVLSYLKASAEHLTQWADLVVPLKARSASDVVEHHFRPQLTLGRCGLEAASQAVWALGPDDHRDRMLRHFRLVLWDLGEERRALANYGDSDGASATQARIDALVSGDASGFSEKLLNARMRYLDFIAYSAEREGHESRVWERLWRGASGAAHGRKWISHHSYETAEGPHPVGAKAMMRGPKLSEITSLTEAACVTLTRGFSLYCERAGLDEQMLLINGAIHTLDITPAGPGMEEEKALARLHFEAVRMSASEARESR